MSSFTDMTGRTIDIGDVILFTMSTDGSAARMQAGEVVKFNPKSLVVQPVEVPSFTSVMEDDYYTVDDGPAVVQYPNTTYSYTYQPKRRVVTGQKPVSQQLIPKPEPYRFYILKKV